MVFVFWDIFIFVKLNYLGNFVPVY